MMSPNCWTLASFVCSRPTHWEVASPRAGLIFWDACLHVT